MKKILATALIALALSTQLVSCGGPAEAQARTITYTWTNPTQRTNGTAWNPATDQAGVEISYGTTSGGPYPNVASSTGAATSLAVPMPATIVCGTVYAVAVVKGNDLSRSSPTAQVAFNLGVCPANPVTNLQAS